MTAALRAITICALAAIALLLYFIANAVTHTGGVQVASYRFAFYCLVFIVACMETRIRLGLRIPRGPLFSAHLIFAIPFFLALGALAFWTRVSWLEAAFLALGIGTCCTGSVLLYRSSLAIARTETAA
jgi:hypothetical protein